MDEITNADAIRAWSEGSDDTPDFDEEGDVARRFLLYPSLLELIGNVADRRVLDAGCGQGHLSRLLSRRGARVTGVEPAASRYAYAVGRERLEPLGITYLQEDLSRFSSASEGFDVVIANMVLQDIADYESAMASCIASLKPEGLFVFSLLHPCFEESGTEWPRKRYVEVREYLQDHVRRQRISWLFHRPLSRYLNLIVDYGCSIQRAIEPKLSSDAAEQIGNDRDVHVPSFVVIAATKLAPTERDRS